MNVARSALYPLRTLMLPAVCHHFRTCGQSCIRAVSEHLTNSILGTIPDRHSPCQLTIIGCGELVLETPYITETGSVFPIFTGPSGRTYEEIHMTRTAVGTIRPRSYAQISLLRATWFGIRQFWKQAFTGGHRDQSLGKRIFQGGRRVYSRQVEGAEHLTAERLLGNLE